MQANHVRFLAGDLESEMFDIEKCRFYWIGCLNQNIGTESVSHVNGISSFDFENGTIVCPSPGAHLEVFDLESPSRAAAHLCKTFSKTLAASPSAANSRSPSTS